MSTSRIAIIGMSGRFPGARDVAELWKNLCDGVESISTFTDDELAAAGVSAKEMADPSYVRSAGVIEDVESFDAALFGYTPREAESLDPQHRLFLECTWEALERAGYDPRRTDKLIGVYAGAGLSTYVFNLLPPEGLRRPGDLFQLLLGTDKDYLASRVAYKLDLRGPAVAVQSACSTSLVATHLACQALLNFECDVALAGGSTVRTPQKVGYRFEEGGILSPDGKCRAFDASAKGSVGGNGCGVVVLKRLEDAIEDGDHVHAVILASAINNDGSRKVGYTAPGVEGQTAVITLAHALADVPAESISYVETHGTGTALGDPIEVAALTKAFRRSTSQKGFCALGALKTNLGHMDTAAGVAGLIKATLSVEHGRLAPTLWFQEPPPSIDLASSPFFVNTQLRDWPAATHPRRAGVSAFGFGGTNAHVVLEQAPAEPQARESRPWKLVLLSARTRSALDAATQRLASAAAGAEWDLADAAYTLEVGRRELEHRRMVVARDAAELSNLLSTPGAKAVQSGRALSAPPSVAFLFSGGGAQHVHMGAELYKHEPVFRKELDRCAEILLPLLRVDIRGLLYPAPDAEEESAAQLRRTSWALPGLFAVEYALARLWMSWGVQPAAMLGHSMGEYVAACIAGVFSLEDALWLIHTRSQLYDRVSAGAMLAVALPEAELQPLMDESLSFAAINGPAQCTVTGPRESVQKLKETLEQRNVQLRELAIDVAGHSKAMVPLADEFAQAVSRVARHAPQIPYLSNVTGTWITAEQATDPQYWARHLCLPVRFGDAVSALLTENGRILLEVGPGRALTSLVRERIDAARGQRVVTSMRHRFDEESDLQRLNTALGELWLSGVTIDWTGYYAHESRRRVPLPTYPFERQRCWKEAAMSSGSGSAPLLSPLGTSGSGGCSTLTWTRLPSSAAAASAQTWCIFGASQSLVPAVATRLRELGNVVLELDSATLQSLDQLAVRLREEGVTPSRVLYCWQPGADAAAWKQRLSELAGLLWHFGESSRPTPLHFFGLATGTHRVLGDEALDPQSALMVGALRAAAVELPGLVTCALDLPKGSLNEASQRALLSQLTTSTPVEVVAIRGNHGWGACWGPSPAPEPQDFASAPTGATVLVGSPLTLLPLAGELSATGLQGPVVLLLDENMPLPPTPEGLRVERAQLLSAQSLRDAVGRIGPVARVVLAAATTREPFSTWRTNPAPELDQAVAALNAVRDAFAASNVHFVLLSPATSTLWASRGRAQEGCLQEYLAAFAEASGGERNGRWSAIGWGPGDANPTELSEWVARASHPDSIPRAVWRARGRQEAVARVAESGEEAPFEAPSTDLELAIAELWRGLLGYERIAADDDFFALGGHSLQAVQLVSRLKETFQIELNLRNVFEARTVRALAEVVGAALLEGLDEETLAGIELSELKAGDSADV